MQTASLINHLYSRTEGDEPVVGTPATLLYWTDRSPATVVEVNHKKRFIVVQEDNYRRTDENGLSESQAYDYTPNPDGHTRIFRKLKNGQWAEHFINPETKRLVKAGGCGLLLGRREKYHDYTF
ncbi:MAG: hypothetical protein ACO3E7_08995 [Burkholderiaceae bacterium]